MASSGQRPGRPDGGGRRGMGASPWQGVIDVAQQIARRFSDPVAMEGVRAVDTAGDAIRAFGQALTQVGVTAADGVEYDPRVEGFFRELGAHVMKAADPAEKAAAAIRRAHADQIRRVEEGTVRQRRWDVSAHDQ